MNWLLLRGLARQSGHWGDFPDYMEMALPSDRIYRLDLPGTGSRYQEISPATIPEIRAKVQAAAESLPRPLILVGLSMGGMVALDWACDEPAGLAGVVTINSSSGWSPLWYRMQIQNWPRVAKLLALADPVRRESDIFSLTSNVHPDPQVLQRWIEIQRSQPVTRQTAFRQLKAAARYRPVEQKSQVPMLFIASRQDRLVNHRCSDVLAKRLESQLIEHEWAGHDLPLDDPDWLTTRLKEFRAHCMSGRPATM